MKKDRKNTGATRIHKVPLMKNAFIGDDDKMRHEFADFIMKADRFSMGGKCIEFEKTFAKKQGRKEAILFSSGSSANLAMIQALKNIGLLHDGDKVGFSALTWATNVMPILQLGLSAIPIDCDTQTLNSMSKNIFPTLEKEGCKALFITNVLGFAGDLGTIQRECKKRNITILEDSCEALGTKLQTGKTGNFSLASSFSFYVAHHMSTIEGGMVCTDDKIFAEMLRMVRSNGWDRNLDEKRQKYLRKKNSIISEFHAKYTFYELGYNFRPTEITGFLGLLQLPHLDEVIKIRERNFKRIQTVLASNKDFLPLNWSHLKKIPAFALPFVCKDTETKKRYVQIFTKAGVEVRPMIAGNMQLQPFYKKNMNKIFNLPGADFLHNNAFYCGNCPDYTEQEIQIIIKCIK